MTMALPEKAGFVPVPADWNSTRAAYPDLCAHVLFEQQVARAPEALAVAGGGESLSYKQLNSRANAIAHQLLRRGVGPDTLVGVSMHRSPLMVAALLGVWKAGAAYVPMDPMYPTDRLAFMLDDSRVVVLLAEAATAALFSGHSTDLLLLDTDWPTMTGEDADNPANSATPANLAYVIYTSGSTGKPKGALITHSGLVNYLWWAIQAYGVRASGSVPVHSSISFDLTVTSLYPALLAGGSVELVPDGVGAQELLRSLRHGPVRDLVKITPAHLELITQQVSADEAPAMTRTFVIGGENLTAESLRLWREVAPRVRLINEYGPTETVVGCCVHEVGPDDPQSGSVPIGRPIANTELYVLDEALQPVGVGAVGELYIGGAGVARGYLNRPDLTRERFLPDPFCGRPAAMMYKTGDLARYRPDGVLEYLGRIDTQVKLHGYRIELGEIEQTLSGHQEVQSCAVLLREDHPGNRQLVAYAVIRKDAVCTADSLRQHLRERLPDYMIPAHIVILESFPLTQNGKVDRRALPPPTYSSVVPQGFVAPTTPTERALSEIWTALLNIGQIGIYDDVFHMGATSLMVLSAVTRIRRALGATVDMSVLFEHPTVAEMAPIIEASMPAGVDTTVSATVSRPELTMARQITPRSSASLPPHSSTQSAALPHLIPIRFGEAQRQLVGLYHAPAGTLDRREACVICNPFGQEEIRAHSVLHTFADYLARGGFHVLRFDYYGTGDSEGEDVDVSFDAWIDDVLRADDEIRRRGACRRSVWLGLRLGATAAALASARSSDAPRKLLLWEPVIDGPTYLRELERAHIRERSDLYERRWARDPKLRARIGEEAQSEFLGYPITPDLRAQVRRLSPPSFRVLRTEQLLLAGAEPSAADSALSAALDGARILPMVLKTASNVDWTINEMLRGSVIPASDMRLLTGALLEEQ
jgi:amino acid adenylation domain-containing protein